jgi:hypothetical protein
VAGAGALLVTGALGSALVTELGRRADEPAAEEPRPEQEPSWSPASFERETARA